ncbi:FIST signal transduction protein [Ktedonobacter racemifer]|uniref:FIST domain-containing protein n=1 Tax=Ktedonobacter racemifer DSM 44963 TaxID=485913 RepID=D6TJH9_KTERA|nr:FIST N-terminal domain-containing protein [Ktedonobacter racemifer]EFH89586.1 protein of unknown function DUF1745 [Ktedonobacter racemifer DSM 44963]
MASNEYVIVSTSIEDSRLAGRALGWQIREGLSAGPDVVILFLSPHYEQQVFLHALKQTCRPDILIGCTSMGAFTSYVQGGDMASALAIRSHEMLFQATIARNAREDVAQAAEGLVASLSSADKHPTMQRTLLLFGSGEAGKLDALLSRLLRLTHGSHQLLGMYAGMNTRHHMAVLYETEALREGVVALEILSSRPIGLASFPAWSPVGAPMLVTKIRDNTVLSIDDVAPLSLYRRQAEAQGLAWNAANDEEIMRFLLNTPLGIDTGMGQHICMPCAYTLADGSVTFLEPVPLQGLVQFMRAPASVVVEATEKMTRSALQYMHGYEPGAALFFEGEGYRPQGTNDFRLELDAVQRALGSTPYGGCSTRGQYARVHGQYGAFQRHAPLICIFPR